MMRDIITTLNIQHLSKNAALETYNNKDKKTMMMTTKGKRPQGLSEVKEKKINVLSLP